MAFRQVSPQRAPKSCNVKDPFGPLAFIVYLLIMEDCESIEWHNFFGSRGQLVPLFRDLDDGGQRYTKLFLLDITKISTMT